MVFWFLKKRDDNLKEMHNKLHNSFTNLKGDIEGIISWINHFKNKHDYHDKKHEEVLKQIETLKQFMQNHIKEYHPEEERSIVHERVQSFNRSDQSFMNVQSEDSINKKLTPSQKKVIHLLLISRMPLDYKIMAKELKVSVVTVKRHINDIKKIGFGIKEKVNVDTRSKVFYVENKIKKALIVKK
ncbi:MAG: HTH domain-containing protein [Nanoarchaeota archaeon]|nr:HTH domain-containing protein [Nanoarchaeota archaeon]